MTGRGMRRVKREAAQAVFRQFADNLAGKIGKGGAGAQKPDAPKGGKA
jgi:hypothetical protein